MVTQPQLAVFASSPKRLRSRTVHGTEFRFVFVKPEHYFGTDEALGHEAGVCGHQRP